MIRDEDNRKWGRATLRIASKELSVGEITQALETPPTGSYEKGDRISPRLPPDKKRKCSLWKLESESEVSTLERIEEHLGFLATFIETKIEPLRSLMTQCEIDIFCGYSSGSGQGGFTLSPELLKD
jgi:hypothetical protein